LTSLARLRDKGSPRTQRISSIVIILWGEPVQPVEETTHVSILVDYKSFVCLCCAAAQGMILVSIVEKRVQAVILEGEKATLIKRAISCNSSSLPWLVSSIYNIIISDVSCTLTSCLRR